MDLRIIPQDCPNKTHGFMGIEWTQFVAKMLQSYEPREKLRLAVSRLVVRAKDLRNGRHVVLKFFYLNQEQGYTTELCLPALCRIPNTLLPLDDYYESPFGMIAFPDLSPARPCYPKSWQTWLRVLEKLFQSLDALHAIRFAHLDVNPSNILLKGHRNEIQVFLIDFGLAELESDGEVDEIKPLEGKQYSGTFPFIDPVFIETGLVSTKSDMWSVGIMLAESVALQSFFTRPFSEDMYLMESTNLPERFIQWCQSSSPKPRLQNDDLLILIQELLVLDQNKRLTSKEALSRVSSIMERNGIESSR